MNKITISGNNIKTNTNIKIDSNIVTIDNIDELDIIYDNANIDLILNINKPCKIFEYINNSKLNNTYNLYENLEINRFSINSSLKTIININKENKKLDYAYKTINIDDNYYIIDINHNAKNTNSNIISYGINYKDNKLDFLINSIIPKESIKVTSNQDSKIILLGKNKAIIKPNLLVDNDDISASHASFIGYFDKEKLFYLNSRGITLKNAIKLLTKAFLLSNMNITYLQKEMILKNINDYWR